MNMWVLRPGPHSVLYDEFMRNKRVYIWWEDCRNNLLNYPTLTELKEYVATDRNITNATSITTTAAQLNTFAYIMSINDYILIPGPYSRFYALARIIGPYEYKADNYSCVHSRAIEIIEQNISRDKFDEKTQHSLGAFRTLFSAKDPEKILEMIKQR